MKKSTFSTFEFLANIAIMNALSLVAFEHMGIVIGASITALFVFMVPAYYMQARHDNVALLIKVMTGTKKNIWQIYFMSLIAATFGAMIAIVFVATMNNVLGSLGLWFVFYCVLLYAAALVKMVLLRVIKFKDDTSK